MRRGYPPGELVQGSPDELADAGQQAESFSLGEAFLFVPANFRLYAASLNLGTS